MASDEVVTPRQAPTARLVSNIIQQNQINRVQWIDTAKGFGIVLVVVGHLLRGLTSSHLLVKTPAIQLTDAWIYSFHMPLFFFLSGLFLVRSATRSSLHGFASDKIRTIAYPYLVWSTLTVLLKGALGEIPNTLDRCLTF